MSVLLGVLFFFGLPLMVWYVIIRATYRIETAGRSAHRLSLIHITLPTKRIV